MKAWEIRRSATRGVLHAGWLEARFSFSFGDHPDPARPRFGPLLALNEDRVQPDTGFPLHPHRDLEIVMLPLAGAVEHHDDQGGHAIVRPGQWQWMRAGRGIRHRQWNPSPTEADHHLQIWLAPGQPGRPPHAETVALATPDPGAWRAIVSREPGPGARDLDVDATLLLGAVDPGRPLVGGAHGGGRYLHVVDGPVVAWGDGRSMATLDAGDALVFFDDAPPLTLTRPTPGRGRVLRFDTPPVDPATGLTRHRA